VSNEDDEKVLKDIEKRFEVALPYVPFVLPHHQLQTNPHDSEYPEGGVDSSTYMA
jgi:ATP-dependent RNA helicase UAP56/SUB2